MCDERRRIIVIIAQFYLQMTTVGIQCRENGGWPEVVETFVHLEYGVAVPHCQRN